MGKIQSKKRIIQGYEVEVRELYLDEFMDFLAVFEDAPKFDFNPAQMSLEKAIAYLRDNNLLVPALKAGVKGKDAHKVNWKKTYPWEVTALVGDFFTFNVRSLSSLTALWNGYAISIPKPKRKVSLTSFLPNWTKKKLGQK